MYKRQGRTASEAARAALRVLGLTDEDIAKTNQATAAVKEVTAAVSDLDKEKAKAEARAGGLGLIVNPGSGLKEIGDMHNTMSEVEELNKKTEKLAFDIAKASDNNDKEGISKATEELKGLQSKAAAAVLKNQSLAEDPNAPQSLAARLEAERAAEAERKKAASAAESDANRELNLRTKIADQVRAAHVVAQAIARGGGTQDMATALIEAEAAAQGLTKGLEDAGVKQSLLFVAIVKGTAEIRKAQIDKGFKLEDNEKKLDMFDELVASGMKLEDVQARIGAIGESNLGTIDAQIKAAREGLAVGESSAAIGALEVTRAVELKQIEDARTQAVRQRVAEQKAAAQDELGGINQEIGLTAEFNRGDISSDESRT